MTARGASLVAIAKILKEGIAAHEANHPEEAEAIVDALVEYLRQRTARRSMTELALDPTVMQ